MSGSERSNEQDFQEMLRGRMAGLTHLKLWFDEKESLVVQQPIVYK